MSNKELDIERIAKRLGAVRRGRVSPGHGFFGALQLVAEVQARFRTPANGGRATDPNWEERRLVPLTSPTLERLERLAVAVSKAAGQEVSAMQIAGILLEKAAAQAREEDAGKLLK